MGGMSSFVAFALALLALSMIVVPVAAGGTYTSILSTTSGGEIKARATGPA